MAYVIRSRDGRTTICTASADAAVEHVERLQQAGLEADVVDMNGRAVTLSGFVQEADALKATQAKILQSPEAI